MLPRFGLLCVCLVMALTAGLVASSSSTLPAKSLSKHIELPELDWIDRGLGHFRAEILEFRDLRKNDEAVAITDKPLYYMKLRLIEKENSPSPISNPLEVITLAVGQDMSYLKIKNHQELTLLYQVVEGKLKQIYYMGC